MLCRNLTKNLSIFQQNKNDEPRNNPLQAVGQRSDPYGYQAKFNPFYSFSCVCCLLDFEKLCEDYAGTSWRGKDVLGDLGLVILKHGYLNPSPEEKFLFINF